MNAQTANTIINQTTQYLQNGQQIDLTFRYPTNFKIGDQIEVTDTQNLVQLIEPQHEEGFYSFDIEVWDDRVRLYCDSIKEVDTEQTANKVYTFKIREIDLFASKLIPSNQILTYN